MESFTDKPCYLHNRIKAYLIVGLSARKLDARGGRVGGRITSFISIAITTLEDNSVSSLADYAENLILVHSSSSVTVVQSVCRSFGDFTNIC